MLLLLLLLLGCFSVFVCPNDVLMQRGSNKCLKQLGKVPHRRALSRGGDLKRHLINLMLFGPSVSPKPANDQFNRFCTIRRVPDTLHANRNASTV